jgi:hypothetical protein
MLKPSILAIKMDTAKIERAHSLIDSLYKKIQAYNKEVSKSNKLLREQENLRKKLGIKVKEGRVSGLVKEEDKK